MHFINDWLTCDQCYNFNSVLVKNNKNQLIRICNVSYCNSTCLIEYSKSDDKEEEIMITMVKNEPIQQR